MSATSAGRRHLLDSLIRQYAPNSQSPRWGYYQLIDAIRQRSSALSVRNAQISNHNAWNTADLLRSIRAMSFHFRDRVRSPWDWNCEGNPLQSLSSHLFARFGVAKFMHRAWLEAPAAAQLLIDLGQGQSVRTAIQKNYDRSVSRKTAHLFANAPDRFGIHDSLRWSALRAGGCDDALASAIVPLTREIPDSQHDFWLELSQFLQRAVDVQSGTGARSGIPPDVDEMRTIVSFVCQHKFQPASRVVSYPTHQSTPLQPDFTLRGRTIRWLRDHMLNWENEIQMPAPRYPQWQRPSLPLVFQWAPVGLKPLSFSYGESVWRFVEITDADELRTEGSIMRHCVGSYHRRCVNRISSIWSLRRSIGNFTQPKVTIEYQPRSGKVIQAKGKCNAPPSHFEKYLIGRWAQENGIETRIDA